MVNQVQLNHTMSNKIKANKFLDLKSDSSSNDESQTNQNHKLKLNLIA